MHILVVVSAPEFEAHELDLSLLHDIDGTVTIIYSYGTRGFQK